jgi:hypothetical protein
LVWLFQYLPISGMPWNGFISPVVGQFKSLSLVGESWCEEPFPDRGKTPFHLGSLVYQITLVPFQVSTLLQGVSPTHFSDSGQVLLIYSSPITSNVTIQVWDWLLFCLVIDWVHNKSW